MSRSGYSSKPKADPKPDMMASLAALTPIIRVDLRRMGITARSISNVAIKHRIPRAHVAGIAEAME